jgi:hypothetical protein
MSMPQSDEWIGIIHSTMPKYLKGASDLTIRKRLMLAMLRRRGRILYNMSGDQCIWQVEFSQPPVEQYSDGGVIDFANHDAFRQLAVDWRGYVATDSLSKKQRAMNSGKEALIPLFTTKQSRLMKSIDNKFAGELYKDGEAVGRESSVHGFETVLGVGTVTNADKIAAPSDTYSLRSKSTVLGTEGGQWTSGGVAVPNNASIGTDWPDGSGDSEYDYLSPKLVNWSANSWGTNSQLWEENAWRVIGQTITWLTLTGGEDGMPTLCAMAGNMFQGYKNSQEALRRINIPHKEAQDLGFGQVLNQDGCALYPDFDCPINTAYMVNLNTVELKSLFSELFWYEGPDKDPRTAWSYLWGTGFFGNMTMQPKHLAKIFNYDT